MKKENILSDRLFYLFKNLGYFVSINKPFEGEIYKEDLKSYLSNSEIASQIIAQISSLRGDWFSIINTFRDYLMNGISLKGQDKTISLIDWQQPENNIFRFSFFRCKEKKPEKLWIIYVNGFPLVLLNLEACFKGKFSQISKKLKRNACILKYEFPNKSPFLFKCLQLIVCSNYRLCFYSQPWSASIFEWFSIHKFHLIRILFGSKIFNFYIKYFKNFLHRYSSLRSIFGFSETILNRNELLNIIKNQIYISDSKNNKGFSNILLEQHVRRNIEQTIKELRFNQKAWARCNIDKELKYPLSVTFLLKKIITCQELSKYSVIYLTFKDIEMEDEITEFIFNSCNFLEGIGPEIIKWENISFSPEIQRNKIYISSFKKYIENAKQTKGVWKPTIFLLDWRTWLTYNNQISPKITSFLKYLNQKKIRNHPIFYLFSTIFGKKVLKFYCSYIFGESKIVFLNFY